VRDRLVLIEIKINPRRPCQPKNQTMYPAAGFKRYSQALLAKEKKKDTGKKRSMGIISSLKGDLCRGVGGGKRDKQMGPYSERTQNFRAEGGNWRKSEKMTITVGKWGYIG